MSSSSNLDGPYVVVDNTAHRIEVYGPYTSFRDAETVYNDMHYAEATLYIEQLEWRKPSK